MTTTRSSAAQCDRILALIDACLAEVVGGPGGIDGERRPPSARHRRARHLTLIRS